MSSRLYADICEAINNVKFDLRVPDSYTPVVPGYFRKYPERESFLVDEQPFSFSKLTCAEIIDMCNQDIQFIISNRSDVEVIVGMITKYTDYLRDIAGGMPEDSKPNIDLGRCNVALNILRSHNERAVRDRTRDHESENGQDFQSIISILKKV